MPGRPIVRRVRDANPDHIVVTAQGELVPAWLHHALFTVSALRMLDAEAARRGHAVIEQVIADLKSGPIAHLPSSSFNANEKGKFPVATCLAESSCPRGRCPRPVLLARSPRRADELATSGERRGLMTAGILGP